MNPNDLQKTIDVIKIELQPLADKIGQGAGWTYELFLRQVYVNAFMNLLWVVPGIIAIVLVKKVNSKEFLEWEQGEYLKGLHLLLSALLIIGSLCAILLPMAGVIQAVVNPNFTAIQLIISTIQGDATK